MQELAFCLFKLVTSGCSAGLALRFPISTMPVDSRLPRSFRGSSCPSMLSSLGSLGLLPAERSLTGPERLVATMLDGGRCSAFLLSSLKRG